MIKMVFCLHRLPHLSREEFQRYWREKHAPLVAERASILGIRRYKQVHTLSHPMNDAMRGARNSPEPFDGVAELWWDSVEDLSAATAGPEGRAAYRELVEDERRFIDLERSPIWIAEERSVVPP